MDYGKDHYATVSWSNAPDDRHTVIAWMSNWQYANNVPTKQYRSANSLPRDLGLYKVGDGDYYLTTVPAPETLALRGKKTMDYGAFSVGKNGVAKKLPVANNGICEVNLELDARTAGKVNITLSNLKGEQTVLTYNLTDNSFGMDRTRSGLTDFSKDFPAITLAPAPQGRKQHLHLFIDRCSIEAFDGEGRFVMTNLVFPTEPYTTLSISTDKGRCRVGNLTVYPLEVENNLTIKKNIVK